MGGMPRNVMLVTGPSRSADIEQTLELGAHGPRRLIEEPDRGGSGLAGAAAVQRTGDGDGGLPRHELEDAAGCCLGGGVDVLNQRARAAGAKRVGTPEDVAAMVAYIVSPAGDLLQGAIIDLDGGTTKGL